MTFEEKMKRLEEIVAVLQKGEVQLNDSLKLFEEGAKLVGDCKTELDTAEQKVSTLLKGANGPVEEPFKEEN